MTIGTYRTAGSAAKFSPPPAREPHRMPLSPKFYRPDTSDEPREHHGLWLGVFIGALLGLLIGTITLLVFELNRRDALDDIKTQLQNKTSQQSDVKPQAQPVKSATTNTAPVTSVARPAPQSDPTSNTTSSASASLRQSAVVKTGPAPELVGSSPADGATAVSKDMVIGLIFSESMMGELLTQDTVTIYENGKNVSDRFTYNYRDETHQLVMRQDGQTFAPGALVEIRVTADVQSQKGVPLKTMEIVKFTVAS